TFLVQIDDQRGGFNQMTFSLAVTGGAINHPPQFQGDLRDHVHSGQLYFAPLNAVDPDGDRLDYTLDASVNGHPPPDGLAIVQVNGAYALEWDTNGVALGSYPIRVRVSDGRGGSDAA